MKAIRIFLLVLIIIGLGLIFTQSLWVPNLVAMILQSDTPVISGANIPATTSKAEMSTAHVTSQISAIPNFGLSYPANLGKPVVSLATYVSSPLQNITFYEPTSPHDYPNVDSNYFLNIGFSVNTLTPGQTFENSMNKEDVRYEFTVDGHRVIAQASSKSSPLTWYYVEWKNNSVLGFLFDASGASVRVTDMTSFRSVEDKIVQSIKFAN
jgi:hypothetical protein